MNPLLVALQFLTRLPIKVSNYPEHDMKSAVYWYGVAGLIIGLILYWFNITLAYFFPELDRSILAGFTLALWVIITGALHLDGLADSADAWLGGLSPEKALLIMKDPRSGPAGVTAIVLILLLKFACLQSVISDAPIALIIIPALARCFVPILFFQTKYVRQKGLGQHFSEGLSSTAIQWQFVALTVLSILLIGFSILATLTLLTLIYFALRKIMIKRLGGTTGDTAGGMIEILELGAMLGITLF